MQFLKDLREWLDHPVTQSVCITLGSLVLLGAVDRANRCADNAHDRIDELQALISVRR
jgi:hypothetical protein